MRRAVFDGLVIGGCLAGSSGAPYLARYRLSVMLVDAGACRAQWIPVSLKLPLYPDGVAGAGLLRRLRAQLGHYGVAVRRGHVDRLERVNDRARAALGDHCQCARTVLLATGVVDQRPVGLIAWIGACSGDGEAVHGRAIMHEAHYRGDWHMPFDHLPLLLRPHRIAAVESVRYPQPRS